MLVLAPELATRVDAVRPRHDERDRVTALVRVDLVEPERRVARHRPTARVVRRGGRAADLVDPGEVGVEVVALEEVHVVRGRAAHLAFPGRAVVGGEHEDRVVELAEVVERRDHPAHVLVDAVDHARVDLHVPGEQALLVDGEVVPRPHVVVALGVPRCELHARRHHPELLLAREPLGAQRVPTRVVATAVLLDVLGAGVQRRVHRPVRDVTEERPRRVGRLLRADHRDRAVGDVVGEVVVVGIPVDLDGMVVLHQPVRVVQVGERVDDAVVLVEAALERPAVARTLGAVTVLGEVPLAHRHRGVAGLVAQDLGHRHDVGCELARVAGEAGVARGRRCRARRGAARSR